VDNAGPGKIIEAMVRKVARIETNVDWIKKNMEKDEKHFTQIYRNKEEIQKVKTIGGVLFALVGLVASFLGFNVNK
tara:strand:- start:328 stop:555 length:228 start_codon:yes stop_codon:yes gene_type:complete